jgi:hypothetical protein
VVELKQSIVKRDPPAHERTLDKSKSNLTSTSFVGNHPSSSRQSADNNSTRETNGYVSAQGILPTTSTAETIHSLQAEIYVLEKKLSDMNKTMYDLRRIWEDDRKDQWKMISDIQADMNKKINSFEEKLLRGGL